MKKVYKIECYKETEEHGGTGNRIDSWTSDESVSCETTTWWMVLHECDLDVEALIEEGRVEVERVMQKMHGYGISLESSSGRIWANREVDPGIPVGLDGGWEERPLRWVVYVNVNSFGRAPGRGDCPVVAKMPQSQGDGGLHAIAFLVTEKEDEGEERIIDLYEGQFWHLPDLMFSLEGEVVTRKSPIENRGAREKLLRKYAQLLLKR